jgi:GT2 family glycosyltransferase
VSLSAIVPTVGASPWLRPCLEALRRDGGDALEIVVVDQGEKPSGVDGLADRVLRPERNLGFAAANNLGIAAATGSWIATVNDDALVEPGWSAALIAALEANPTAATAQGTNVKLDDPETLDGCGVAWNRWVQAVQIGHGEKLPDGRETSEIFGVSATAAIYRREALAAVAPDGEVFDPRLVSYYEDVDLACRLRKAGWRALHVPAARARHAGSATGSLRSRERWAQITGNRYLVAARWLGADFRPHLPAMATRDLLDLGRSVFQDRPRAAGILAGWKRAFALRHVR